MFAVRTRAAAPGGAGITETLGVKSALPFTFRQCAGAGPLFSPSEFG
jgi:hypothetical protein